MYKLILITVGVVALTVTGPVRASSHLVDGQVTKIDESAGKITLKHGPLKKFDMADGMSMVFRVQDPAMLKQVKVGDKVKFEPDKINGQFTVIKMEKATQGTR